jgi:hypothetical protein
MSPSRGRAQPGRVVHSRLDAQATPSIERHVQPDQSVAVPFDKDGQ